MTTATAAKPKTTPQPQKPTPQPKPTSTVRTAHDVELEIRAAERKLAKIETDLERGKRFIQQGVDYAGKSKKRNADGGLIYPEYHAFWTNQVTVVMPEQKKELTAQLARLRKELAKAPADAPKAEKPTPKVVPAKAPAAKAEAHPVPKPSGKKTNREIAREGAAALGATGKSRRMIKSPEQLAREAEGAEQRAELELADSGAELDEAGLLAAL